MRNKTIDNQARYSWIGHLSAVTVRIVYCLPLVGLLWLSMSTPPAIADIPTGFAPSYQPLSDSSLDKLVGPVALYPDALLAQVAAASTHSDEIALAARWLKQNKDTSKLDEQEWDPSVIALAHYPSVIEMMASKPSWTDQLGLANSNEPDRVALAVQRMRAKALKNGNLADSPQQKVVVEKEVIQIVSASPEVIYVPQYTTVVYTQPANPYAPLITFGAGLAMGAWLSSSNDYHYYYGGPVYYGGPPVYGVPGGGWGGYYNTRNGSGSYYRGAGPAGYGSAANWQGNVNGNYRESSAARGTTWNGNSYAARSSSTEWKNGATTSSRANAAVVPGQGAAVDRGWSAEKGDNKAAGGSRTVATQNGAYRVSAAGASNGSQAAGGVKVSGVDSSGNYGSKTFTGNSNGAKNSYANNSGNAFQERQNFNSASAASNRGYASRSSGSTGASAKSYGGSGSRSFSGGSGGRSYGGGGRSFGGGGGRGRR